MTDAARVWGRSEGTARMKDGESIPTSKPESREGSVHSRAADGGFMPFDMDVPVAYGAVAGSTPRATSASTPLGVSDLASPNAVSSAAVDESAQVSADVLETVAMMANIETSRIPCPRLCGATFGPGVGGLAGPRLGSVGAGRGARPVR